MVLKGLRWLQLATKTCLSDSCTAAIRDESRPTFRDEMQYIFLEKTLSSKSFSLLKMSARTSFDSQKGHENDVSLQENIIYFVSKCTKHHKYVESQMAACALEFIAYHCNNYMLSYVVICGKIGSMSSSPRNFLFLKIVDCIHGIFWSK